MGGGMMPSIPIRQAQPMGMGGMTMGMPMQQQMGGYQQQMPQMGMSQMGGMGGVSGMSGGMGMPMGGMNNFQQQQQYPPQQYQQQQQQQYPPQQYQQYGRPPF